MSAESSPSRRPWLPYVAPLATFLVLTSAEGYVPKAWYPIAYTVKIAVVAAVAWWYRAAWRDFRPRPSVAVLVASIALGVLVTLAWVGLDPYYPRWSAQGSRSSFDPTALPTAGRFAFLAVRLIGLILVVPLIEELFWRSFLMRSIIDPDDFTRIPVGRVTPPAAAITSVAFAAVHPEWLPALLTGLAWAALLWRTRSLAACLVSHATANLVLGAYVLATGEWRFL